MTSPSVPSPYVGLRPFREADYAFFFGRERDTRILISNLRAQTLTVLYGASGIGKSSVLQAGVVPQLRSLPNTAVAYFSGWQSADFQDQLMATCRAALGDGDGQAETLDDLLIGTSRRVFLLLDQFEEFLLYHGAGRGGEAFEEVLARIVNRDDLPARILIGIREDALSKFDQRFSIRIPDLLGNTLVLEHLTPADARAAVEGPIATLNRQRGTSYSVEPGLTDEVLKQVQAGNVSRGESTGVGTVGHEEQGIETAFLQLVLKRLWDEEIRHESATLRRTTLDGIGGASRIVQIHVDRVMATLADDRERAIAARLFRYLVTPSRTKIAQHTGDLIAYGEAEETHVRKVLERLTDNPDARILRRLGSPERFEIFHDVLAQPILDWRRRFIDATEREQQERDRRAELQRRQRELEQAQQLAESQHLRAEEQARAARRLRWMAAGLLVLLAVAAWLALLAQGQRERAEDHRRHAEASARMADRERQRANQKESEALAAQKTAEARLADLDAAMAREAGRKQEAADLSAEANRLRAAAVELRQKAREQEEELMQAGEALSDAGEGRDRRYRELTAENDSLRRRLMQAEGEIARSRDPSLGPRTVAQNLFLRQGVLMVLSDHPFRGELAIVVDEVRASGSDVVVLPVAFRNVPAPEAGGILRDPATAEVSFLVSSVPTVMGTRDGPAPGRGSLQSAAGGAQIGALVLREWRADGMRAALILRNPGDALLRGVRFNPREAIEAIPVFSGMANLTRDRARADVAKLFEPQRLTARTPVSFPHNGADYELRLVESDSVGRQYVVVEIVRVR